MANLLLNSDTLITLIFDLGMTIHELVNVFMSLKNFNSPLSIMKSDRVATKTTEVEWIIFTLPLCTFWHLTYPLTVILWTQVFFCDTGLHSLHAHISYSSI